MPTSGHNSPLAPIVVVYKVGMQQAGESSEAIPALQYPLPVSNMIALDDSSDINATIC